LNLVYYLLPITNVKNRKYTPSVFFLFLLIFNGCVKENEVPAYISVPSFSFTTVLGQGTAAQKISDVWVFLDGQSLGAYQIPARFPVLGTGKHEFLLFPGIRNNGIRSNPVVWGTAKTYTATLTLAAGDEQTIRPTSSYTDLTKIWINEDFERTNTFTINRDNNAAVNFVIIPNGFEGNGASITLNKANPIIEKASVLKGQLPDAAQVSIIELHYKTEVPLSVGIIGSSTTAPGGEVYYKIVLTPNKDWNKTYIDVTAEAKSLKAKDYQIVLRGVLQDSLNQGVILIDNVKLVQK
jgi:hypothetical protein